MQLRSWTFRVQADTRAGEVVGVTGDVPQLGDWKVDHNSTIVLLSRDPSNSEGDPVIWSVTTWIPFGVSVHYRYYICLPVEDKYTISHREVSLRPRLIPKDLASNSDAAGGSRVWDVFGVTEGTAPAIDRGWLTSETVTQLKLHSSPIVFWKDKLKRRQTFVKLTPMPVTKRRDSVGNGLDAIGDQLESSLSIDTHDIPGSNQTWPITEVADMNEEEPALRAQEQFGRIVSPDDFLLFQIQTLNTNELTYLVDLYQTNPRADEDDPPEHIGCAYILHSVMRASEGHLMIPITSTRHRPIGQLTVYYLIILPIPNNTCDMSVSYSKYWKHSSLGLDVGHRGSGSTTFKQKSCTEVRENTIASLKKAASHGADFVEIDVQLSKDLVPVIYHDFHVCISLKQKRANEGDMLEFPLKELTLNQLQCLKLYHVKEGKEKQQLLFDDELEEHQPFPTLQHAFEVVDVAVGFNIEIKWTMLLRDGTWELDNPFDLNTFLDSVLKVCLEHGGSRKLIFSCFHPDICTMVKYKQSKYPVTFLTQGVTSRYPMYHDPRCHTITAAVRFAHCLGMLGINVHTEDILRDPGQLAFAKNYGLVIFCWGDENNDPETISYLKKLGLHGVIYDRIDEFGPKKRKPDTVYLAPGSEEHKQILQVAATHTNAHPSTASASGVSASWLIPPQQI